MIGLDLSATRPASVQVPDGWRLGDWSSVITSAHQCRLRGEERLFDIHNWACSLYTSRREVGWIESPLYQSSNILVIVGEVRACVKLALWRMSETRLAEVQACTARKLLLGKNPATRALAKAMVMSAWSSLGAPFGADEDICDAMTVANYGLFAAGKPFFAAGELKETHTHDMHRIVEKTRKTGRKTGPCRSTAR